MRWQFWGGAEHQTRLKWPDVVDGCAQSPFGRHRFFFVDEKTTINTVNKQ